MLDESVATIASIFGAGLDLVRVPHTDQIWGNASSKILYMRNDVAPQIGRRGIAVKKNDWSSAARFDVGHLVAEHLHLLLLVAKIGGRRLGCDRQREPLQNDYGEDQPTGVGGVVEWMIASD